MDGGVATMSMGPGFQQPRKYFSIPPGQLHQNPQHQQHRQNIPPQQNQIMSMDPNKDPNQAPGQVVMFDGKRMRKAVHRKTVDYNSAVIKYLENRCWQRDERDYRAIQPDALYQIDITPPMSMRMNPMNGVTTKFIRTSTNKFRCPIFCLAWTPEGRRLVTGASSGEFTLWNGLTFNFETILQAHDTSVRAMVWSNNDSWMVTGDHSGFIKYWQSNMNNVKMFQGHKEPVRGISFSPSDNKFTTCSDDGTVRIWDFQKCQEEKILRGHGADVKCVGWHPHKSLIASGSKDNQQPMKLWDARTGQCLATLHTHKMTVMQLQWNKNGNWLLTASRDHLIKLFDIRNMKEEVQTFKGHKKEATAIDWHPTHEGLFASGGSDGAIMFWHVGTDRELGGMETAHEGMVWSLAWHPLGHILASGSNDHTTKFWTRNRPGDRMRDKYNLNTLGGAEHEVPETELDSNMPVVTAMSTIPGVNEGTVDEDGYLDRTDDDISIPGLDWESDSKFLKDQGRDVSQRRKIPYARPIDREFVHAWRSNKQPPAISGEKLKDEDKKPKAPLPSLLDLPSMKPSADFDLDTLKDEEGDRHGKQLRQGRNKDYQRERRGFPSQSQDRDERSRDYDERDRNDSRDFDMDERSNDMMDRQDNMDTDERMDNDERNMRNHQGMMGNQGSMGDQGMMGNQQGMMGNQGPMGNRPMMNNPGMMNNQQGPMGNQQRMMGQNRPALMGDQPGMMGNKQGLMGNQPGMMGQNRPLMGNQPGMRGPNPNMMGNRMSGPMGGPQGGMMGPGNRMGGPQGNQRMPGASLLGQGPGMGGQGPGMGGQGPGMGGQGPGMGGQGPGIGGPNGMGQNMNRSFGMDEDFRSPNPSGQRGGGPNQNQGPRGGFNNDTDYRNQDSDYRNQDTDFRDNDMRRNRDDNRNMFDSQDRDNRFGRQEEMMDFDERDNRRGRDRDDRNQRDNFGGRNRDWNDGGGDRGRGGRGGGRGGRGRGGRGGWRGGR